MQCRAISKAGLPCRAKAMSNGFCYRHNPNIPNREKLIASSRGGKKLDSDALAASAKPIILGNLSEMLVALTDNANDLRRGRVDTRTSNAIVQNVLAAIEIYKTVNLETRISALERELSLVKAQLKS